MSTNKLNEKEFKEEMAKLKFEGDVAYEHDIIDEIEAEQHRKPTQQAVAIKEEKVFPEPVGQPLPVMIRDNRQSNAVYEILPNMRSLVEDIAVSKLFGEDKNILLMKVLKGRELGIEPIQAVTHINVIQGKVAISSELMLSLIFRSFPKAIMASKLIMHEGVPTYVIKARRGDWVESFTYSVEDANRAGLMNKDNWKKHTRAMLRARAISEMARAMFPDVISGASYTPEELE